MKSFGANVDGRYQGLLLRPHDADATPIRFSYQERETVRSRQEEIGSVVSANNTIY